MLLILDGIHVRHHRRKFPDPASMASGSKNIPGLGFRDTGCVRAGPLVSNTGRILPSWTGGVNFRLWPKPVPPPAAGFSAGAPPPSGSGGQGIWGTVYRSGIWGTVYRSGEERRQSARPRTATGDAPPQAGNSELAKKLVRRATASARWPGKESSTGSASVSGARQALGAGTAATAATVAGGQ